MMHPTAAELLELHFGEAGPVRAARLSSHVKHCPECRGLLSDVAWAERLLAETPLPEPPAGGLDRVLDRVGRPPAGRQSRSSWPTLLPAAAALAGGTLAIALGGATAALAFFAAGSLVTLSLAPALILESQRRDGAPLAR